LLNNASPPAQVNIVPVVAKADTMTPEEVTHFKKQIMNQIVQSKIKIYEFPDCEEGEAEENERNENQRLKERVPFAVVGSNTIIETAEGKKVRGRKYPWGVVDVRKEELFLHSFIAKYVILILFFRLRISTTATSSLFATCSFEPTFRT
jgi:septin family protein